MPSRAYGVFKSNIKQVDRLLEAYNSLKTPTRGRKALDHLTRAALMFLCSSWEVYLEQIALEVCDHISSRLDSPSALPEKARKSLSLAVKNAKHDLEPISFAVDWKSYYHEHVKKYTDKLNTPKNGQVLEILEKYLGVDVVKARADIPSLSKINAIVKLRGEIAHNVYAEAYVKEETVIEHKATVEQLVKEMELFFWEVIPDMTNGMRPWQNTYQ